MTLAKFKQTMSNSKLKPIYFKTNISTLNPRLMRISTTLRKMPFLEEFFTWNVYSIWRNN